ncbi:type IV secretion protein IcmL [Marinobacter halodurans]|uniref:Type IV secretion protein IcmL n=1 Tax=Marinobacter halodurans TaxID=2528979 RepID=A0ABY1ZP48_9GAMM|nr:DotI/IcmL family type IV secretion protein [Marinobacter halodurans]TBW57353.1 type IV secretion protein IcmL [Marinobacter halodurans]
MAAALVVMGHNTSRLKTRLIVGLFLVAAVSLTWNSVQNWTRPEPKLLGMTTDGRIQELPLLDKPLANRQVLIDWVRRHIPTMYDFNYANYHGELNKLLKFMKPVTLDSFREMLDKSGILDRVTSDFLILQGRIVDEPLVQNDFVVKGTRVWVVEIPMKLIYDAGEKERGRRERINQDIIFKAYIARANPLEYPGGLILAKFGVSPRKRK